MWIARNRFIEIPHVATSTYTFHSMHMCTLGAGMKSIGTGAVSPHGYVMSVNLFKICTILF